MGTTDFLNNLMHMQSAMLNVALMLTSNRDDAYDLLQDTTLKALDNQSKYADNVNFKGWIFTIMRNTFINNYRRSSKAATLFDDTDSLYHHSLSPDYGLMSAEGAFTVQEVTDVVNSFPLEYREPFSMHIAGYKYNEIAERLKLPVGTVKSRIFFARKRLQKRFSDYA